jgi:nitrate reductase molybdenum cofactor assembly chaperone NarJ/NarW
VAQGDAAHHYVETFDLRRRCALYLTYYRCGDTRMRGMAMLNFKTAYRVAAFDPTDDELPDYLPLVLEFASLSSRGEDLLRSRRADVELLRKALHEAGSPYASVVDAVAALLPRLRRRDLSVVQVHWEKGPPHEDVGLEPFAPPEYLGMPS